MSRKIEVGCLVLILSGKTAGKTGRVLEHDPTGVLAKWEWAVDIGYWERNTLIGFIANSDQVWKKGSDLLRIDDYNEETETQEEELTV